MLPNRVKHAKTTTAIKDHMLFSDYVVSMEEFNTLASINSELFLKIKRSILISRNKPEKKGMRSPYHFTYLINVFPVK